MPAPINLPGLIDKTGSFVDSSGRRANMGLQLGPTEHLALLAVAKEAQISRHAAARLLICEALRLRGRGEADPPGPAEPGAAAQHRKRPTPGPLAEWELDTAPIERTDPIQGVRLGPQERELLIQLAQELGLPPARLARRLLVKGLCDLHDGQI